MAVAYHFDGKRWTPAGFVDMPAPDKASVLFGATVHDGRFWALGVQESKVEGLDDAYMAELSGDETGATASPKLSTATACSAKRGPLLRL